MTTATANACAAVRVVTYTDGGVTHTKTLHFGMERQEFLELKELHRHLLRAWVDHKAWTRWFNKTVYKRAEPRHSHLSSVHTPKYGSATAEFASHGQSNLYFLVLRQYRDQRQSHPTPDSCIAPSLPADWKDTLARLREFYGN